MDVKTKESKGTLEAEFKETSPSFVNALRRIMIGEINTSAIEEVHIKYNNSALQDELVAQRLGLIPLKGEGTLKLEVKGPKVVKASDFEVSDGKVDIIYKEIPIIEIIENQKIELTAKVKTGAGKEHSKWQAAIVGYEYKNPDKISIMVESCSGIPNKEILEKSLERLKEKASAFKEEVSKYKSFD